MGARKHLVAVNRAIGLAGLDEKGLDGPMVELLRDLARRMDAAGPDGPPLNLMRSYLSATKDLARAAARKSVKPAAEAAPAAAEVPVETPGLRIVEESALDRIRNKKQARAS
jgi:hypothetical protein